MLTMRMKLKRIALFTLVLLAACAHKETTPQVDEKRSPMLFSIVSESTQSEEILARVKSQEGSGAPIRLYSMNTA